jgi:hypothetical protein
MLGKGCWIFLEGAGIFQRGGGLLPENPHGWFFNLLQENVVNLFTNERSQSKELPVDPM